MHNSISLTNISKYFSFAKELALYQNDNYVGSNENALIYIVVRAATGEFRRVPGSSGEPRKYTTEVRCAHSSTSTGSMSYCSRQ